MSSSAPTVAKPPFLVASAVFCLLAGFIAYTAIRPLGAADLLGMGACVAAAAILATIPFTLEFARRHETGRDAVAAPTPTPASVPELSPERLNELVAAAVDARLAAALPAWSEQLAAAVAASGEKHREELLHARSANQPAPVRAPDADDVVSLPAPSPAPVPAGAKPRLGRGLLGLIQGPGAITPPPAASDPERDAA